MCRLFRRALQISETDSIFYDVDGRTADPTYFEHKIKLQQTPDKPNKIIYEYIPCYTKQRDWCFFCVGEKFDRPLQELYDAHCKYWEDRAPMKSDIFRNWEEGLDAWDMKLITISKEVNMIDFLSSKCRKNYQSKISQWCI